MRTSAVLFLASIAAVTGIVALTALSSAGAGTAKSITLPEPMTLSAPLSDAMRKRRTVRSFNASKGMRLTEVSTLLYAMQGKTSGRKRTVPSPHAVYPLELYIAANNVDGLENGLYHFDADRFILELMKKADVSSELAAACYGQAIVRNCQVRIIVTCTWGKLVKKTGDAAKTWGAFESGSASQNGYLAAAALGLNAVPVGGMDPAAVAAVIGVDPVAHTPVIVNCFGR